MSSYDEIEFKKMMDDCLLFSLCAIAIVIDMLLISYVFIKDGI